MSDESSRPPAGDPEATLRDPTPREEVPEESASPFGAGDLLGRYEIRALIGAGGMGRVYSARDPSLEREVAIKALGRAIRDSTSLRRFEREARVLANLSHPNIATIYGLERLDGSPYLVLELVQGESLAQKVDRGPLTLRETVAIAVQVARGLEEAHAKGIIHRDLKPSNVMIAAGGRVKLVDFGLAKDTAPGRAHGSGDRTTIAGTVLGTAPYMSPEQVEGDEIDTRTDVWAFGCLLFEMLSGKMAFRGRSVPDVMASVLRDEPDWSELPPSTPPAIRRLLRRCLRKDPVARLQHIGDARVELLELDAEPAPPARRRLPRALPWGVAAAALLAAGALLVLDRRRAPGLSALKLSLELPRGVTLSTDYSAPFAISPDGATIVVEAASEGTGRLYARDLHDLSVRALPGTESGRQPFFSPDGRWVAFFADRKLKKVPLDGGPALPVCDIGSNSRGGSWSPDGTIVFAASQTAGLWRVPEGGGRPAALTTVDRSRGEYSHRWPEILPGGKWVLFSAGLEGATFDEARLEAVSPSTGERRLVVAGGAYGRFAAGHVVFVRGGRLYAAPLDLERMALDAPAQMVLDGVRYEPQNGAAHVALSPSGALVYGPAVATSPEQYLAWLSREGKLTRIVSTPRLFRDPALAPDGARVAVAIGTSTESDLFLVDENGTLSQLTFGLAPHRPTWTPDGRRVTVGAQKDGAWRIVSLPADGGGEPEVLHEGRDRAYPCAWSPDGRYLVYQENRNDTGWDLFVLEVNAAGKPAGPPRPLARSPFQEANASISRDGRWVAYESDEPDALFQVHVVSFPDGGHKVRGSPGGARWPCWGAKRRLFYWDTGFHGLGSAGTEVEDGRLLVELGTPFFPAEQKPPDVARMVISVTGARFAVDPARDRFLVLETGVESVEPALSRPVVALDWARRLPGR